MVVVEYVRAWSTGVSVESMMVKARVHGSLLTVNRDFSRHRLWSCRVIMYVLRLGSVRPK
jgi:hypothetical protein